MKTDYIHLMTLNPIWFPKLSMIVYREKQGWKKYTVNEDVILALTVSFCSTDPEIRCLIEIVASGVSALLHTTMEGICLGQVLKSFCFYSAKAPKIQVLERSCLIIQSWRQNTIMVCPHSEWRITFNNYYANTRLWKSFQSLLSDIYT